MKKSFTNKTQMTGFCVQVQEAHGWATDVAGEEDSRIGWEVGTSNKQIN